MVGLTSYPTKGVVDLTLEEARMHMMQKIGGRDFGGGEYSA